MRRWLDSYLVRIPPRGFYGLYINADYPKHQWVVVRWILVLRRKK